jgi:hypothetical protein
MSKVNDKADVWMRQVMSWPLLPPGPVPLMPGRVVYALYQHDDWCRTLNGGTSADCNCDPIVTRHLVPKDRL